MLKQLLRCYTTYCLFFSSIAICEEYKINPISIKIGDQYLIESKGGLRFKEGTFGTSRIAYTDGAIAVSPKDNLIYVGGHNHHFSVGAFDLSRVPVFGNVSELPILKNVLPFVKINPKYSISKTANIIKGLEAIDNYLLISTDEYYDADANNREHLVIFTNRYNLALSEQNGYFSIEGASHSVGWMSKIPVPLSNEIGYLYLTGSASNLPINSRQSIGPTFYGWFPFFLGDASSRKSAINAEPLINYSLETPLHNDIKNASGKNDLWTEMSTAVYGFISPDQKSYIVIGHSGGHNSEIGYKIVQDNGHKCGGNCARDATDYTNYYWVYSITDIKNSKEKKILPHSVRPQHYGKLNILNHKHLIIGADYDIETQTLYLLIDQLDNSQNKWEKQPILMPFQLSLTGP